MATNDPKLASEQQTYEQNEDRIYGVDLHPRHEAWARISTRGTLIGFAIFVVLAAMFVLWVGVPH